MPTYGIGVANSMCQFKQYYGFRHGIRSHVSFNVLPKIGITQKSMHRHRRPYDYYHDRKNGSIEFIKSNRK